MSSNPLAGRPFRALGECRCLCGRAFPTQELRRQHEADCPVLQHATAGGRHRPARKPLTSRHHQDTAR